MRIPIRLSVICLFSSALLACLTACGGGSKSPTTPTVSAWPTAGAITYGQTLASSTLTGGTTSVAGAFAWTTPSTAPGAGTPSESVTFTPTDTTDYNTPATGSVALTVNKAATKNFAVMDTYNSRVLIFDAPFSTNQNASVVLGQPDFAHGAINQGGAVGANTLYGGGVIGGVAADTAGNLYVTDGGNCRVLQFVPPFTNNMNATVIFGQTSANQAVCLHGPSVTASSIWEPGGAAVDSIGDLWVADISGSRILEYTPPFSTGMSATLAIGQSSTGAEGAVPCNQGGASPTASTLCDPYGLAFDPTGNLWVVDNQNSRILEFKPPFSTGMAASLELGQPSAAAFTSKLANNGGISAGTLSEPFELSFDSEGNLWVGDFWNYRVLEYTPPFTSGMNASLELGQPAATAFTSKNEANTQSGLSAPGGVSFDTSGNIYVSDYSLSRILIYDPSFSNGMDATIVLGQPDFTSNGINQNGSIGANTLSGPVGNVTF
jgi:sugar lactone lactonase YvrE